MSHTERLYIVAIAGNANMCQFFMAKKSGKVSLMSFLGLDMMAKEAPDALQMLPDAPKARKIVV
jgi:hypothetical protein